MPKEMPGGNISEENPINMKGQGPVNPELDSVIETQSKKTGTGGLKIVDKLGGLKAKIFKGKKIEEKKTDMEGEGLVNQELDTVIKTQSLRSANSKGIAAIFWGLPSRINNHLDEKLKINRIKGEEIVRKRTEKNKEKGSEAVGSLDATKTEMPGKISFFPDVDNITKRTNEKLNDPEEEFFKDVVNNNIT